ncbi:hypothetical protein PLIIFM63780_004998 [Purpureocillium lilacinum]|nr:hypothetical protein PLICBS_001581 [Purpureocillium lilacinum]GJN81464.1 hypothetical protein PLIIFM63780_004998 [Purpureocillium lilacinum]
MGKSSHAILLTLLLHQVSAFGINCQGTFNGQGHDIDDYLKLVSQLDDNGLWGPGEQIMCNAAQTGCLFTQKTNALVTGYDVKILLPQLRDHGCNNHGSIPLGYPAVNDVNQGELTSNAVDPGNAKCVYGICPPKKHLDPPSQDPPAPPPSPTPETLETGPRPADPVCAWAGHCVGAPCKDYNDCSDSLVCRAGVCATA